MEVEQLVSIYRQIIQGPEKSWVLFAQGTCVVLPEPHDDLPAAAVQLLKDWGPVREGSSFGDFCTFELEDAPGWIVTCHHDDIMTYVAPHEFNPDGRDAVELGLLGRTKRGQDAEELTIVHVEHNATPQDKPAEMD